MHALKNLIQNAMNHLQNTIAQEEQTQFTRSITNVNNFNIQQHYQESIRDENCIAVSIINVKKSITQQEQNQVPLLLKQFENELGIQLLFDKSTIHKVRFSTVNCKFL